MPLMGGGENGDLTGVLQRFCRQFRQLSVRHTMMDELADCTWQVRLRDRRRGSELVAELEQIEGVKDVSLVLQEEMSEV
jgi:hypothetical protein